MNTLEPLVTYLAYSAGMQSHYLLEVRLRGDVPIEPNFIVLNADPGMENVESYIFVEKTRKRCAERGIPFITAPGPNLFKDGTENRPRRWDNPPFWTKNRKTGKIGKLKQCCTIHYKIRPMRRALRCYLFDKFGFGLKTSKLPPVNALIGFAADEHGRVKPRNKKDPKYVTLRYPLIEAGIDRPKVDGYYLKNGIPKPPRSVCNACFANGLAYYRDMADNRPDDFEAACKFDEMNRDMTRYGVEDECFVSSTCIPLRTLEEMDFDIGEKTAEHRCNSGVCFL